MPCTPFCFAPAWVFFFLDGSCASCGRGGAAVRLPFSGDSEAGRPAANFPLEKKMQISSETKIFRLRKIRFFPFVFILLVFSGFRVCLKRRADGLPAGAFRRRRGWALPVREGRNSGHFRREHPRAAPPCRICRSASRVWAFSIRHPPAFRHPGSGKGGGKVLVNVRMYACPWRRWKMLSDGTS